MQLKRLWNWCGAFVMLALGNQAAAAEVCSDPGSSMLWEVSGPGLGANAVTMHLFGSIHLGKPDFYPLHPTIEKISRDADTLVFEIDPTTAADPQVAMRMQLRGMLPAGQTLTDVVSPEALANLEEVLGGFGIPLANFMTMKPWLLTLMLANVQASALGYSAQHGLESYFIAQKAADTEIEELESLDQQVDMLDSLDPELLLGYSLQDFDDSSAEMEALISAWRCADKPALSDQLFSQMQKVEQAPDADARAGMKDLYRQLYTDRNKVMADGIVRFIESGSGKWFVVVGSAHLLGAGSVVELLEQRGYTVRPVRLEQ
ncbi:MAG: TraB/GumN family protein [Pseudomonadota bacterium]|nr:TraB/GumN family protein [Pseudomonadota bacterium]